MTYNISYEANPRQYDMELLGKGIMEYRGHDPIEFFAFFIKDENDKILGGCNGDILYGCLYVAQLWVDNSIRGKGYGVELMRKAEQLGREKGCNFLAVNTMNNDALGFYRKLGYVVEFERRGFVNDYVFYFLRKQLITIPPPIQK